MERAVALKACGCEPSAQRPVVASGAVPSLQTICSGATSEVSFAVALLLDMIGSVTVSGRTVVLVGQFILTSPKRRFEWRQRSIISGHVFES